MKVTNMKRFLAAVVVRVVLFLLPIGSVTIAQEGTIDLVQVPCPFTFGRGFCNQTHDYWRLSGNGDLAFLDYSDEKKGRYFKITAKMLNAVYFSSKDIGWVVGEHGTIFATIDRGTSWTLQVSGVGTDLNALYCPREGTCWVVGDDGVILHTNNQGRTWRRQDSKTSSDLRAVHFVASSVGWVVGSDGIILKTENDGATWVRQQIGSVITLEKNGRTLHYDFVDVHFTDARTGWLADPHGVAYTLDGGRLWTYKELEGWFLGVVSSNGREVFAINRSGANYYSSNSGVTWNQRKID